jgi:hypothetical protein
MSMKEKNNASGGDIFRQKKRGRVFAAPPIGETRNSRFSWHGHRRPRLYRNIRIPHHG